MSRQTKSKIKIPEWIGLLYTVGSLILVPWVIWLAESLPTHHLERHYDAAWVGLDIGIMIMLLITGFLASKKSRFVILTASAIGTLLIVDVWFDIISSKPGSEMTEAIVLALLVELPLAFISYFLAYKILSKNIT